MRQAQQREVRGQLRERVPEQVREQQRVRVRVRVQVPEDAVPVPVPGQEPGQVRGQLHEQGEQRVRAGARWRHRNHGRQWRGSRKHHASTVRWCRSSKPTRPCRFSSCLRFARQRPWREQLLQTTLPLY